MLEYCVYTLDPNLSSVFEFIRTHQLKFELHLNRTRFWVPEGHIHTLFALQFAHCCPLVDK